VADHPIIPPPELVTSLRNSAPHGIRDAGVTRELWLINSAYAAGADQELEACCEWLDTQPEWRDALRTARRPKPPTLAEQGMEALRSTTFEKQCHYDAMFAALKRLAELEAAQ
jgi:hypothetical protein